MKLFLIYYEDEISDGGGIREVAVIQANDIEQAKDFFVREIIRRNSWMLQEKEYYESEYRNNCTVNEIIRHCDYPAILFFGG